VLAALGSIPWVGGFISAMASAQADEASLLTNVLQSKWLEEHAEKIKELQAALGQIMSRFEALGMTSTHALRAKSSSASFGGHFAHGTKPIPTRRRPSFRT
jgi:hypothetical protein